MPSAEHLCATRAFRRGLRSAIQNALSALALDVRLALDNDLMHPQSLMDVCFSLHARVYENDRRFARIVFVLDAQLARLGLAAHTDMRTTITGHSPALCIDCMRSAVVPV